MITKRVLCSQRLRRIPAQFSWIDHRLMRENYLPRCQAPAWALYLLLVCVGDSQGLSYYSNPTLCRLLSLDEPILSEARRQLQKAGLIAYEPPLYQVLDLAPLLSAPEQGPSSRKANSEPVSIGAVIEKFLGGVR